MFESNLAIQKLEIEAKQIQGRDRYLSIEEPSVAHFTL